MRENIREKFRDKIHSITGFLSDMTEQARESIRSMTDSLLSNFSFGDDQTSMTSIPDENISVFEESFGSLESSAQGSSVGNVSNANLEVTTSVSDRVDTLGEEEPDREKIREALVSAYSTCMKRFERAIGDININNDIIKLAPVSPQNILPDGYRETLFR